MQNFKSLCKRYIYPAVPNRRVELIEFWSVGLAAGAETPNDIETLSFISNRMQENVRNPKLYDQYPALEELNDELLGFEDMDHTSDDIDGSINSWHKFALTLIERTKEILEF